MGSPQYFDFIRNVWKQLDDKDKERLGELWMGYERVVASVYQKFIEAGFGTTVNKVFVYGDERWLNYKFGSENAVVHATTYTTTQDLSLGVNLTQKNIIRFSWDGGSPIQVNLTGAVAKKTTITEIVHKINAAAGFTFVKALEGAVLVFTSPTVGVYSKISFFAAPSQSVDASEVVLGLGQNELPKVVPDYPYTYALPYPKLVSIPKMRDAVRDENLSLSLVEGTDYKITINPNSPTNYISFRHRPPVDYMWAKRNLFDDEYPWNNFGFLMDIYQKNSPRYAQIIQGLWFAFWTGPRPENIRKALYLLFQLPVAPYKGTITQVSDGISTQEQPGTVTVTSDTGTSTVFEIPTELEAAVVLGQRVDVFTPLVTGIDILDKVNTPGFIETEVGRTGIKRFLTEQATKGPGADTDETLAMKMLEEFTFLPQISVNAFVTPDISIENVKIFLDAIKPVTRTYLFQVIVGAFRDKLSLGEQLALALDINISPNVDSNETTYLAQALLNANEFPEQPTPAELIAANDGYDPIPGMVVDTEGLVLNDSVEVFIGSHYDMNGKPILESAFSTHGSPDIAWFNLYMGI